MSNEVFKEFEAARKALFEKQRVCSWCGHTAQTCDGLVRHILEKHRDEPLNEQEEQLLKLLQSENAS